jgi:serine phosphatase RsbU (regulator of sigma subunit)
MEIRGGNARTNQSLRTAGLDIWIYSQPLDHDQGGGDVYYLSSCASGRITRFVLADVCGHGAAVNRFAQELRTLMRRNINFISQSRFVAAMNQQFESLSQEGGFATALVGTFFAPTRSLTICNAGHPAALVYRHDLGGWESLEQDSEETGKISNTPLGVTDLADYSQRTCRLAPGDLMLCYSDALSESRMAEGRLLGTAGVLDLLSGADAGDPGQIIPQLLAQIRELSPDNLSQDDVSVVLIRANGQRTTIADDFMAPLRLLSSAKDLTQLGWDGSEAREI